MLEQKTRSGTTRKTATQTNWTLDVTERQRYTLAAQMTVPSLMVPLRSTHTMPLRM
jgi:hypothetical protein